MKAAGNLQVLECVKHEGDADEGCEDDWEDFAGLVGEEPVKL